MTRPVLLRARLHVLQVGEDEAVRVLLQQGDRIGAAMVGPEDIELELHGLRIGLRDDHVEQRARGGAWRELEPVGVVEELEPRGRGVLAGGIEGHNRCLGAAHHRKASHFGH